MSKFYRAAPNSVEDVRSWAADPHSEPVAAEPEPVAADPEPTKKPRKPWTKKPKITEVVIEPVEGETTLQAATKKLIKLRKQRENVHSRLTKLDAQISATQKTVVILAKE